MTCGGCGSPLGAPGSRVVPFADSPYGVPFYVCGACGTETSIGRSFRECVGQEATESEDETLEMSWEPCDYSVEDWFADRRARGVIDRFQFTLGFIRTPQDDLINRLAARPDWN